MQEQDRVLWRPRTSAQVRNPDPRLLPWGLGALSGVPGPAAQTGRGFVRKAELTEAESAFSPAPRGFVHRLRLEEHRDETLYKSYDSTVPVSSPVNGDNVYFRL